MSGDALCVGVCMIDQESGVCLGCGRTEEEIHGAPVATAPAERPHPQDSAVETPPPPGMTDAAPGESGT